MPHQITRGMAFASAITAAATLLAAATVSYAPAARADEGRIAEASNKVAQLEQQSAEASERAQVALAQVRVSKQRLDTLAAQVQQAQESFERTQRDLGLIARQLYVNGGLDSGTMPFVLGDAEDFLRSLDQLASAGEAQTSAVSDAREAAEALLRTQQQEQAGHAALEESQRRLAAEKASARVAVEQAQKELAVLREEERRRVAAELAAAREAERVRAEQAAVQAAAAQQSAARSAGVSTSNPSRSTAGVLPGFDAAAAWAATAASQAVIFCESSGNYSINTGNGYYGAWQFDYPSWHWNGGGRFAEFPHQASKAEQDFVAWTYYQRSGWRPWECAQKVL